MPGAGVLRQVLLFAATCERLAHHFAEAGDKTLVIVGLN